MRVLKFLLVTAITLGLIYVLDHAQTVKTAKLPPLGRFFSPFTGFWQNAETSAHLQDQTLDLAIFDQPVQVVYDKRLVPHIFAQSIDDALVAQGYVTAQHRLWQMDIATRSVGGRLAEILGTELLERDRLQRRKGLRYAAENAVKGWKQNSQAFELLEKYVLGINTYIEGLPPKDYPLEFKLLDYAPEQWTPLHTALYSKAMAQSLCMREFDLETTNALAHFGKETFDFLYPEYNPKQSPIVPASVTFDYETVPVKEKAIEGGTGYVPHRTIPKPSEFNGSNNWAVRASKTRNGKPILCTDPHLPLTLPSYWFEIQLHTPDLNTYGVSLPGIPGVVMGFNEHCAWGMTNVAHDVLDWYRIEWADASKMHYVLDGKKRPVENRLEKISVKNQEPVIDTVKYTVWGPVVYESADHPQQDMAMRWLGHDVSPPNEMLVFLNLNRSKGYDDYEKALVDYMAPAQNVVFASSADDIAIRPSGMFPLKRPQQGRTIQAGNRSDNAWQGFIPQAHEAFVKNPPSSFVGSANQRTTDTTFPYYYNGFFDDYRGRYLHRRLAEMDNITIEDMQALQNDNFSIEAEELLPLLLQSVENMEFTKEQRAMLLTLQDWDYRFESELIAPSLYTMWADIFYQKVWDEIYDYPELELLPPEWWRTIDLFANDPQNSFFDNKTTPKNETAADIAINAFETMTVRLEELEKQGSSLKWASHKATEIRHLARIEAFTFADVPIGGYHHALNAVKKNHGPSWRMVVELGDRVQAYGIYPGGQSGNPGSAYYNNMVLDWAAGKYYPLLFVKNSNELNGNILFTQQLQ